MKKSLFVFLLTISVLISFTGCSPTGYSNILLFTDRLSFVRNEKISLESYNISEDKYSLIIKNGETDILITAKENKNGKLKSVGVTLLKIDENGNAKHITDEAASAYKECAMQIIYAFTLFDEEKSREAAEKILPLKSKDLLRTGELTADRDNYHFVYYSNKLCCRFTVTDTYLEKTEITEKPVSRPLLQY